MAPRRFPAGTVLFAAALIMLALHAWLARYAHPMADDLSYARKDVSIGAWAALAWEHLHWNGRYASNILVLFGPLRGGFEAIGLYRLVPVALMGATFAAAFLLLRTLTGERRNVLPAALGALLWTVLHMHAMPDIAEGYYWYTGAVTYQLANALCLVHLALVIRLYRAPRSTDLIIATPLLFLLIGFNEVMMLLMVLVHVGMVAVRMAGRHPVPGWMWVLLITALAAAVIMILAPGNAVRSQFFPLRHRLLPALGMSVLQTARFLLVWCSSPVWLGLGALAFLHREQLSDRSPLLRRVSGLRPGIVLALVPAVVFLCVFPSYWSTGILGQYRTLNVACFLVLPLLFLSLMTLPTPPAVDALADRLRRPVVVGTLVLIVVSGLIHSRNGERATDDLLTGRAAQSDRQLWQRYALLERSAPDGIITLPPIADPPKSLYVLELRADPTFLQNADYALWFGLKEVHLAPAGEP